MEHIICSQMLHYLNPTTISLIHSWVFSKTLLVSIIIDDRDLTTAWDQNMHQCMAILEYIIIIKAIAIDRVFHSRLLYKHYYYGIQDSMLNWLKAFISNLTKWVIMNGSLSSSCSVTSCRSTSKINTLQLSSSLSNLYQ